MTEKFEKLNTAAEQDKTIPKEIEKIASLSQERITDIDERMNQALQETESAEQAADGHDLESEKRELKSMAQRSKEAIYYYTKIVVLGGLVLSAEGDGSGANKKESQSERLGRAKIELKADGITSEQKIAYKPLLTNLVYQGIEPVGYDIEYRLKNLKDIVHNISEGRRTGNEKREDAWRIYLGLQQQHNTFEISDHKPSQGKENKYYYKISNFWEDYFAFKGSSSIKSTIRESVEEIAKDHKSIQFNDDVAIIMGHYKMDAGQDEKGPYISYYDIWNFDIPLERDGFIGKPFEIYERLYYNPITFEPLNLNNDKIKQKTKDLIEGAVDVM